MGEEQVRGMNSLHFSFTHLSFFRHSLEDLDPPTPRRVGKAAPTPDPA